MANAYFALPTLLGFDNRSVEQGRTIDPLADMVVRGKIVIEHPADVQIYSAKRDGNVDHTQAYLHKRVQVAYVQ